MKNNTSQPKIGIVSGIGPLAGADVLQKVFRYAAAKYGATEDVDYPNVVLVSHGINGVDSTGALSEEFEKSITSMVGRVEGNGATVIGIACNTAHAYLKSIASGAVIVNLLDCVAHEASRTRQEYLLLTSATTKQQKLYHTYLDMYGVEFAEVSERQQRQLDETISLVMAYKLEDAGVLMDTILYEAKERGFEAVIAGCTELPIAIDAVSDLHGLRVVDSNAVLASALTDEYFAQC